MIVKPNIHMHYASAVHDPILMYAKKMDVNCTVGDHDICLMKFNSALYTCITIIQYN